MALVVKDRVKETTTTTGTGTVTLGGAVSGFQTFTSVLSNADTTYYAIIDYVNNDFEVGLGTFTSSGTTLARTTILESSNSGSAVDLESGTKEVFITYPAEKSVYLDASNQLVINGTATTSTAAELSILDGDTSATSTTVADADRVVLNDNGTMKQVAVTDLSAYFDDEITAMPNLVTTAATTVGALNSGSITSGFGSIDNGSSAITTTGTITYGSISDGSITVTAFVDEDNMSSNSATLIPTQQSVKAYVDSQVTAQDLDATTDSGTIDIDLDSETLTIAGGEGIDTSATGTTITITGEEATTSNKGVASFSSTFFSVSSGAVSLVAAQTGLTSILNTSLVIGRDADNDIDFATDNNIIFRASGADQIKLQDGVLLPVTDNDIDLGSSTFQFKDAHINGTLEADAITVGGTSLSSVISGTTVDLATSITISANNSTDETVYPLFVDGATGTQGAETDTGLTYNPSSGMLTSTGFTGALTGNASTATILETARTLGGVSFNGSANINLPGVNTAGNQNTTGNAATATLASTTTVTDSTANTNFPVVFHDESNALLDDTGSFHYNPSTGLITATGLTLSGNLTVQGDTVTIDTATLSVEDPLIILAKSNNSSDSVDIGFYGLYDTSGSQDLYAGLFRDASDSGKWKLFKDNQAAPTTTVNTGGTGYAVGTLVANLEGNVTGTASTATVATTVTITDNESTNEDNAVIFTAGGDVDGGNLGLESDGNLTYNPSTGRLTATQLSGTLQTAAQTNVTSIGALDGGSITSGFGTIDTGSSTITTTGLISGGSLDIDNVLINGTTIGHTDDTDLMTVADGVLTVAGELDATTLDISGNADIAGTTNLDAVDIDGAVQIDATLSVGVNDTGYDVKFFGATSGQYMLWDESHDELVLAGDSKLSFHDAAGGENIIASSDGHLEINAGTTLDITAATTQVNASTLFDVNGNADISGTLGVTGVATLTAKPVANAGITVKNGSSGPGFIEFYEDSDHGGNFVKLQANADDQTYAADQTLTLPSATGTIATTDDATALAIALG